MATKKEKSSKKPAKTIPERLRAAAARLDVVSPPDVRQREAEIDSLTSQLIDSVCGSAITFVGEINVCRCRHCFGENDGDGDPKTVRHHDRCVFVLAKRLTDLRAARTPGKRPGFFEGSKPDAWQGSARGEYLAHRTLPRVGSPVLGACPWPKGECIHDGPNKIDNHRDDAEQPGPMGWADRNAEMPPGFEKGIRGAPFDEPLASAAPWRDNDAQGAPPPAPATANASHGWWGDAALSTKQGNPDPCPSSFYDALREVEKSASFRTFATQNNGFEAADILKALRERWPNAFPFMSVLDTVGALKEIFGPPTATTTKGATDAKGGA